MAAGPGVSRQLVIALLAALRRLLGGVGAVMGAAAGWMFVLCSFFIVVDVLGRRWGVSSKATVEITGYMLAFGIAWGLTDALATRSHIRVDVLVNRLPVRVRAWMHGLALAFLVVLNSFLTWRCWVVVQDSWMFGARDSSALTIPLIVPQGLWAAGITLFCALSVVALAEVALLLATGQWARVDQLLGPRTLDEETREALEAAGIAGRR